MGHVTYALLCVLFVRATIARSVSRLPGYEAAPWSI